ncbi:MAG: DUF488 domain-containing protein [Nitrospiraceae bacterium]|nr:DUF488 domain-containing protein [Nitrospiraceae bacterium]
MTIYTVGHSNHPLEVFLELLQVHGIELVVDVRTVPKSRHNPQFNSEGIAASLARIGIAYQHLPDLGGLRHPRKDSTNLGWENESFRGFADYMQTEGFEKGLQELQGLAEGRKTTVMCAEAVPWRCHRSLISDALLARGVLVMHIMSRTSVKQHSLTPFAEVKGTTVTYPGNRLF